MLLEMTLNGLDGTLECSTVLVTLSKRFAVSPTVTHLRLPQWSTTGRFLLPP